VTDLIGHARRELELAQESPEMIEAIVKVIEAFVTGPLVTDGTTSAMAAQIIHQLLRRRPLTPLTNDPAEWIERLAPSGAKIWQSTRTPEAFSPDGGKTYWSLAEVSPEGERITRPTADKPATMRPANIREAAQKMFAQGEDEE
jgi:hypothetical protein